MKNRTEDTTMREEVNIDSVTELFIDSSSYYS